jgi:hypothetical protein
MSWCIGAKGPKDEALKNVRAQAEDLPYKPGTPEGDDVVAALARVEALAAALAPSTEVRLSAYGSHLTTSGKITAAGFAVNVNIVS